MPFDHLPLAARRHAYGVDYAAVQTKEGGDLFVTRWGWSWLGYLRPEAWHGKQLRSGEAERLSDSSGTVYRIHARGLRPGSCRDLVIKHSRMAQQVDLLVPPELVDWYPPDLLEHTEFNDPFEEFGLVFALRHTASVRALRTKCPLGIYCPPGTRRGWQLGRRDWVMARKAARLRQAQQTRSDLPTLELEAERDYILVYAWLPGESAASLLRSGELTAPELTELVRYVNRDLLDRGFYVLDTNPAHIILRRSRATGRIVQRPSGEPVYALVDFELLVRAPLAKE